MIKYKSIIFGSIGTLVETSNIQRKSFNKAFKKLSLNWHWSVNEYKKLLEIQEVKIGYLNMQIKKILKLTPKD